MLPSTKDNIYYFDWKVKNIIDKPIEDVLILIGDLAEVKLNYNRARVPLEKMLHLLKKMEV